MRDGALHDWPVFDIIDNTPLFTAALQIRVFQNDVGRFAAELLRHALHRFRRGLRHLHARATSSR